MAGGTGSLWLWQALAVETTVTTDSGSLRGVQLANGVRRFLGIPYATSDRFGPPVPLDGWSGELDASTFGAAAPQPVSAAGLVPDSKPGAEMSEACQFLNVWTPSGSGPWPVLVWVHGGSFLTGSASMPTYDPAALAARGAVVVSINYRLGPFGFVSFDSLGGANRGWVANAGLHDVVAALQWVRRHIGAFAGAPDRVTVFGESAGGGVILHLLGAPGRGEWFDRAIVQSGSAGRTFDSSTAAVVAERLLAGFGGDLDQLAQASTDSLCAAIGVVASDPAVFSLAGMMPFHPCIDDRLVLGAPAVVLADGAGAGCDTIMGVTRDEMHLFLDAGPLDDDRAVRRVTKYLACDDRSAAELLARYRERLAAEGLPASTLHAWGGIYTDREMNLPARMLLDGVATHHASTWGYEFTWSAPPRPDGRPLGAAHAVDLPFTFSTFDVDSWRTFVGADGDRAAAAQGLATAIQDAWVRFAATGDPGWPCWSASRPTYEFGVGQGVLDDPIGSRAALWDVVN